MDEHKMGVRKRGKEESVKEGGSVSVKAGYMEMKSYLQKEKIIKN